MECESFVDRHKNACRTGLISCLALLAACVEVSPVDPSHIGSTGRVLDEEGNAVPGAFVIAKWEEQVRTLESGYRTCLLVRTLRSDASGSYQIPTHGGNSPSAIIVYKPRASPMHRSSSDLKSGVDRLTLAGQDDRKRAEEISNVLARISCLNHDDISMQVTYETIVAELRELAPSPERDNTLNAAISHLTNR